MELKRSKITAIEEIKKNRSNQRLDRFFTIKLDFVTMENAIV